MRLFLSKTLGGLSKAYYFRQFVFGLIFPAMFIAITQQAHSTLSFSNILLFTINALLYPYSRFVYESIMAFIIGDHFYIVNMVLLIFVKSITMAICWSFALFIAPIGLLYLYFYHSKRADPDLADPQ